MIIRSVGIDPDVHGCAFAYLTDDQGRLDLKVMVVRQKEGKGRDAALAIIRQDEFLMSVDSYHCTTSEWMPPDVLAVEGQDVRYTGRTSRANPQDVCNLSLISGAAIAASTAPVIYCPYPNAWKGNVRKDIKQKRILAALGIKYTMAGGKSPYPVPVNFKQYCIGKVNSGDWKDLTDAAGLALWGLQKYKLEEARKCLKKEE